MKLHIQPVTFSIEQTITQIHIYVTSLTLFQGATIRVNYYHEDGSLCAFHNLPTEISLTAEEYRLWGEDDQYLIAQIVDKLGLTITPTPVEPPPPDEDMNE
jgi:hypothetical protein